MQGIVNPIVRAALWTAVVLAPGGIVLLPLLAADTLRRKQDVAGSTRVPQ